MVRATQDEDIVVILDWAGVPRWLGMWSSLRRERSSGLLLCLIAREAAWLRNGAVALDGLPGRPQRARRSALGLQPARGCPGDLSDPARQRRRDGNLAPVGG